MEGCEMIACATLVTFEGSFALVSRVICRDTAASTNPILLEKGVALGYGLASESTASSEGVRQLVDRAVLPKVFSGDLGLVDRDFSTRELPVWFGCVAGLDEVVEARIISIVCLLLNEIDKCVERGKGYMEPPFVTGSVGGPLVLDLLGKF